MSASSFEEGKAPDLIANEDCRDWWRAAGNEPGEWVQMDLGSVMDVRAVQINFADDKIEIPCPGEIVGTTQARYIDGTDHLTRYILEESVDGENYFVIEDKSEVNTDLTHDFLVREDGFSARYLKLTVLATAYDQPACISGMRVFGIGGGQAPEMPEFTAVRTEEREMQVEIKGENAVGYNILWSFSGKTVSQLDDVWKQSEDTGACNRKRILRSCRRV